MNRIRVILADDHVVVRRGLVSLINNEADMTVVGEAGDGLELLTLVDKLLPDVVLIDLKMPRLNGMEAAREIHRRHPQISLVVLTMHADVSYVESALQAGATGYVLKEEDSWEMCTAIRHAARGTRYLSTGVKSQLPDAVSASVNHPNTMVLLTAREQQVFQQVAEGRTSQQIARSLGISVRTVEGHRANIMAKLNLKTHVDVVRYAIRHGIIIDQD